MSEKLCPKCGEECCRESVDVEVGVIYGPYGCSCGWSEDPEYDRSEGPSPAQIKAGDEWYVSPLGCKTSVSRFVDALARFGVPEDLVREVFKSE